MKLIGPHINFNNLKEFINIPYLAFKLNASTFSFGLINFYKIINNNNKFINLFKKNINKYKFNNNYIIPHSSFFFNLGHFNNKKLLKFKYTLIKEIKLLKLLNINYINCHPGYHLNKINEIKCLNIIIESINFILNKCINFNIIVENTAGQGTSLGYNLNHLIKIIQNINKKKNIGICLDTCHLFNAGYRIYKLSEWDKLLNLIDKKIGINYLKLIHLNDSKYKFFSNKDRHKNLGKGNLGNNFYKIFKKNIFNNIPIILETPNSKFWKSEISMINNI